MRAVTEKNKKTKASKKVAKKATKKATPKTALKESNTKEAKKSLGVKKTTGAKKIAEPKASPKNTEKTPQKKVTPQFIKNKKVLPKTSLKELKDPKKDLKESQKELKSPPTAKAITPFKNSLPQIDRKLSVAEVVQKNTTKPKMLDTKSNIIENKSKTVELNKPTMGFCRNCGIDAMCLRRTFSQNAWKALLFWNEINPQAVDQAVCDECYQEMREILIDRSDEIELASTVSEEKMKQKSKRVAS